MLRFWKAVLRLAFHFDVAVQSYPATVPDGPPRGPALELIDAVDAYRKQTLARFEAFETTTGHFPDRVWEICASRRSQRGHFYREEAARALNRVGARLTPAEIERAFSLLRTAAGFDIYAPPAGITEYAPLMKRPEATPQPPSRSVIARPVRPKAPTPSGEMSYTEMRMSPIEPALAEELGVMSTADLVAKLNEIWKSRGEPPLPQGSHPINRKSLASVVRLYRSELKAGVAPRP